MNPIVRQNLSAVVEEKVNGIKGRRESISAWKPKFYLHVNTVFSSLSALMAQLLFL